MDVDMELAEVAGMDMELREGEFYNRIAGPAVQRTTHPSSGAGSSFKGQLTTCGS